MYNFAQTILHQRSEENELIKTKSEIKQKRNEICKSNLEKIRSNMSDQLKKTIII